MLLLSADAVAVYVPALVCPPVTVTVQVSPEQMFPAVAVGQCDEASYVKDVFAQVSVTSLCATVKVTVRSPSVSLLAAHV